MPCPLPRLAAAVSLLSLATGAAHAQNVSAVADLTLEGAQRVLHAVEAEALARHTSGAIAVVDRGGQTVALHRIDGTFAAAANISIGKARTAALFQRPTRVFEDVIRNGRTPMVALDDFTPLQGGVPLVVDGRVVGAVGVSGAASAAEDEELALLGAAALSGDASLASSDPSAVLMYDRAQVEAAFRRGAVLLDGLGRNYMVHASRRDGPGQAEVHHLDTDILYVISGTATLVTGGTISDAAPTSGEEARGERIDGGDVRELRPGGVMVIPRGAPHWFRDVPGPFTYFVVKVR